MQNSTDAKQQPYKTLKISTLLQKVPITDKRNFNELNGTH